MQDTLPGTNLFEVAFLYLLFHWETV